MPGDRLDSSEKLFPKFAITGTYAHPNSSSRLVSHVAILRSGCALAFGQEAEVWHCRPPIIAGKRTKPPDERMQRCNVHAISFLEDLSLDEIAGIETTLEEIDSETQPVAINPYIHYVAHPPVEWIIDQTTGTRRFRKFSCVGFVLECFREGAEVVLLDLESGLPPVDLETLVRTYGDIMRDDRLRERYGLVGPEPWRIALAGYVLHALNLPTESIRETAYVPTNIAAAEFPSQTPIQKPPGVIGKIAAKFFRLSQKEPPN